MSADYKQGYADGVSDIRNKLMVQVHDVLGEQKQTALDNIRNIDTCPTDIDKGRHEGWIECLEMFQHQLTGKV